MGSTLRYEVSLTYIIISPVFHRNKPSNIKIGLRYKLDSCYVTLVRGQVYYLLCIGKVNTRKTKGKTRKAHIILLPCGFPKRLASISNGIGLGNFECQSLKDWLPGVDESLKLFVKVDSFG